MGTPDIKELFEIHTWPWLSRRLSRQLSRRLGGRLRFRAAAYFVSVLPSPPTGQASVPAGQGFLLLMHLAPSCFIQELPVKNN